MKKILSSEQITSYRNMFAENNVAMEFLDTIEKLQDTNPLDHIMGIEEASDKWGLESTTIRKICQRGEIEARKIGETWIMASDVERPRAQQDLFVWQNYVMPSSSYPAHIAERFKELDLEHELQTLVHKLKKLKDNRIKGHNRRSIKGNVIDQLEKMSILLFATIGGEKEDRKQKLIDLVNKKLFS